MTSRRLGTIVAVCIVLGVMLTIGTQWLTSGGVAIPTAGPSATTTGSSIAGVLASPGASQSTIGLPDPNRTPGAINSSATQANLATTVCKSGWATSVRPPAAYTSALKLVQIIEYGYADRSPSHYQEDHLVPLELGGAPRDHRNLWPEPNVAALPDGTAVGSKQKDALENVLHGEVCAGTLQLADAQRLIARNWVAAWESAGRP